MDSPRMVNHGMVKHGDPQHGDIFLQALQFEIGYGWVMAVVP